MTKMTEAHPYLGGHHLPDVLLPAEVYDHPWGYASETEWHEAIAARDSRLAVLVPQWTSEDEINLARRVQRAQEASWKA
jgi:hypothetical protein